MVVCELDNLIAGEILGYKLPAWQALLLHRVLPSCGGLVVYLTLMCYDLALIYEHYYNGDTGIALFCTILMVLPALLSLIFTLASPPPGIITEDSTIKVQLKKKDLIWMSIQIVNFIFFPVAAIGRYCHQIFWWIEAVFASNYEDEERTSDAIQRAKEPSPVELYLFLQSFIHAAPHVVVNLLDLMAGGTLTSFDRVSVQAVSIIASTLRMASTATIYRRFEREKLSGNKYPWNCNASALIDNATNEHIENFNNTEPKIDEEKFEPVVKQVVPVYSTPGFRYNSNLIQFSPDDPTKRFLEDIDSISDYTDPSAPGGSIRSPGDSDDEYVRPISIIDRVAPTRKYLRYNVEKVDIVPPPIIPAPRPASLALWAERVIENVESVPEWLSAPSRRRHVEEVVKSEPDLPNPVPRKYMRGLEPQDATAALVHFLGWHMFFIARLLSIAVFIHFSVFAATIVLFSHYQITLLLLIIPEAPTVKRGFYIFLAFIYLFCLMEFKIRFRHVRVWHVFWCIVCTIETLIFTALWATIKNTFESWWKDFIVIVVFGSTLLSYMCLIVYFVILKPKETIVYIKDTDKSEKRIQ